MLVNPTDSQKMTDDTKFPSLESHLPDMMDFVSALAQDYQAGDIDSWPIMAERVHLFFTPDRLNKVDALVPGWRNMASYAAGATLVHVTSVLTALLLCPEFQHASHTQQALMKWVVFFHDIAKEVHRGRRDFTHGFRSAAMTGATLPGIGFAVTAEYDHLIKDWIALTNSAMIKRGKKPVYVQDNRRLPEIINGIERMFGYHTPPALIVKTVLFHMSINVLKEWPQATSLTETEIRQYLDLELLPLLKVMMLVDNDSWAFFDPPTKEHYQQETLDVFRELRRIITA
jgi:hypothetical protein